MYPKQINIELRKIALEELNNPVQNKETQKLVLKNDFRNYKEFLLYLKHLGTNPSLEELKIFADCGYCNISDWGNNKSMQAIHMLHFYSMLPQNINNDKIIYSEEWDSEPIDELFTDNYFEPCFNNNSYSCIDFYAIAKAELMVLKELPDEYHYGVSNIWLWQDKIEYLFNYGKINCKGLLEVLGEAYKIKGWKWFGYNENDPILFRWALFSILSAWYCEIVDEDKIKHDIFDIYEIIILISSKKEDPIVKSIKDELRKTIDDISKNSTEKIIKKLVEIKNEKDILEKELEDKKEQVKELLLQIQAIRKNNNILDISDDNKIEKILERILVLSNISIDEKQLQQRLKNFQVFWFKISKETQNDIIKSISVYETTNSYDLALLPLLRSIEREFKDHIFIPFKQTNNYLTNRESVCSDKYFGQTHNALRFLNGKFPMIGQIIFIGRFINDDKALSKSVLLSEFNKFINKNIKEFVMLTKFLENVDIEGSQISIKNIRNGIAHGDSEIINMIDEKIFNSIVSILHSPPIQLLTKITQITMK